MTTTQTTPASAEPGPGPGTGIDPDPAAATSGGSLPSAVDPSGFRIWGIIGVVGLLGVMVVLMLARTEGHFLYVIDDPAIHLAMGDRLAHSGTWGVSPGVYQSASSSPLWTTMIAGFSLVLPRSAMNLVPLLLNVAAAVWIVELLARNQSLLRPSRRHLLDGAAVVATVGITLFLPGLAVVGMEHTLHGALLLQALVLLDRSGDAGWAAEPGSARTFWWATAWLFLAGFTRFETAFVGAAIGVALLVLALPRLARRTPAPAVKAQIRRVVIVGAATVVPLLIYSGINKLFGQGFLPNSVAAKTAVAGRADAPEVGLETTMRQLSSDALVLLPALLALVYLLWAWTGGRQRRAVFSATVVLVAAVLHSTFAAFGWYERYQAYLVLLGIWFILQAGAEVLPANRRMVAPVLLLVAALVMGQSRWGLITGAPLASDNTYRQRYAAAEFLERNYKNDPIATGELGYIGWYHDGPITDILGLGDFEVLQARSGQHDDKVFWDDLIRRRGDRIVAMYPSSLLLDTPDSWILVGTWKLNEKYITAVEDEFQFWAPTPDDADRIRNELLAFKKDMPQGATLEINPFVDIRKAQVRADPSP